jgi:hypothetical protein
MDRPGTVAGRDPVAMMAASKASVSGSPPSTGVTSTEWASRKAALA